MQVSSFSDLLNIESVVWLCFSVQLAMYEPELADGVQLRALSFKTIFDNVQFLKLETSQVQEDILELKIHFQWLKRFASKLKQDAQKESSRLAQLAHQQEEIKLQEAQKNAIVEHVQRMMDEIESQE